MNLAELRNGFSKTASPEILEQVTPLYMLLDLGKEDFYKILKAVGCETVIKRLPRWERLLKAEEELTAKEKYIAAKRKLEYLRQEKQDLEETIALYEKNVRKEY
jgi:hypothetical protein